MGFAYCVPPRRCTIRQKLIDMAAQNFLKFFIISFIQTHRKAEINVLSKTVKFWSTILCLLVKASDCLSTVFELTCADRDHVKMLPLNCFFYVKGPDIKIKLLTRSKNTHTRVFILKHKLYVVLSFARQGSIVYSSLLS